MPVARLVKAMTEDGPIFEFAYIQGAKLANAEHGFLPFLSFPDLNGLYRSSDLLPFFQNRLMTPSRPDYVRYLGELGLERGDADPMTVLARSRGFRSTDQIELFAPPRLLEDNKYETHLLLRGIRHMPHAEERIERLKGGERLYCLRDFQNDWNPKAIAVRSEDKQMLGYLPDYLCGDLTTILDSRRGMKVQITVEKVNPAPAPIHHRLLCHLTAEAPEGFHPFSDDQFLPIVETAFEISRAA